MTEIHRYKAVKMLSEAGAASATTLTALLS
ncbi:hypothetical protein TCK1_2837 [Pseudomonas monteilii]|jgi:hypothetical protein|uniref:Uncharacterized protein n=1 Tax=Pseudomonas monteilii TaxID=76759 RepID=A0AAE6RBT6_9PSED|nr:hypothetical protein [Pseudomonas sp. OG7]QHB28183.1 hypothetical protein TCK1_2837 [Pseudomonas monteilii]